MTEDEAATLIGGLLPADRRSPTTTRLRMTREAGGSPFVLEQLALLRRRQPWRGAEPRADVRGDVRRAARRAPPDARRFLETLAICGRPMAPEVVCEACGVARDRQSLVAMLRSSRFIRSSGSSERVETYHDRIREVLAAQIAPDAVRGSTAAWWQTLVARQSDDCEALFEHYRGAGDPEQRGDSGGLCRREGGRRARLRPRGVLLPARAGAGAGLADRVTRGGKGSPPRSPTPAGRPRPPRPICAPRQERRTPQRVELQRRAAEQFLIGGHIDRGLDLIRTVLASVGHAPCRAARAPRWFAVVAARTAAVARAGDSSRGPPPTSTPMRCCASTPAGRRRPGWRWWT